MPKSRRLQLLLEQEQYARVAAAASQRHVSVATVIRDAIDNGLAPGGDRRAAAARSLLAAQPMPVPDVDELRDELDALRGRRG